MLGVLIIGHRFDLSKIFSILAENWSDAIIQLAQMVRVSIVGCQF